MTIFTGRPAVGTDDGCLTGVDFYPAETWIAFGKAVAVSYHAYFRVPNVTIPQGANIISAKLTFKAWEARTETVCRYRVYMNDIDTAVAPTSIAEYAALDLTTAFGVWNGEEAWVNNISYDSDVFTSAVQEVVNRPGWASGQAMMALVTDEGSDANARRTADAQEQGDTSAALLTINWAVVTIAGLPVWF